MNMNNQPTLNFKLYAINLVRLGLLGILIVGFSSLHAQVNTYKFTQSLSTYTPINGTVIDSLNEDDVFHMNIPLGFTFDYNGNVTNKIGICTNGYVVMDSLNHSALWSPTAGTINQINVFMADLKNVNANGSIQYQTTGSAPNRVCTIQWKNYGVSGNPNAVLNGQIRLFEGSNCIQLCYGTNLLSGNVGKSFSVGLIGNNVLDYFLRTGTQNWLNSAASTSYPGSGLFLNPLVELPSGLVYSYGNCPAAGIPYYYFKGSVFKDVNNNGIRDGGELGIPNITVYDSIHTVYTLSDINGDYSLPFHDSTDLYRLKVVSPDYWTISSSPEAYTLYPDTQSVINRDFGLNALPYVHDIRISATPLNIPLAGKQVTMSATYQNIGTALIPSDSILLIKDARYSFASANPMPDLIQGDTIKWAYTNLQVEEYRQISVTLLTDNSVLPTDTLHSTWLAKPLVGDTAQGNNILVLHQRGNVPITPNGKSVMPEGPTLLQQEMVYNIRFQNTSNGYVPENIVIRDTLSSQLDLTSFRVIGSTHPMTYTLSGNGYLTFKFQNINLPDSNVNEPGSHGAVSFSIKSKPGLAANTLIANTASIYFDFLPGIVTNTTQNNIILQWPNSIKQVSPTNLGLVYPNPNHGEFVLQLFSSNEPIHVQIINLKGQVLLEKTIQHSPLTRFNVSSFGTGMYYLILNSARGKQVISFTNE